MGINAKSTNDTSNSELKAEDTYISFVNGKVTFNKRKKSVSEDTAEKKIYKNMILKRMCNPSGYAKGGDISC